MLVVLHVLVAGQLIGYSVVTRWLLGGYWWSQQNGLNNIVSQGAVRTEEEKCEAKERVE